MWCHRRSPRDAASRNNFQMRRMNLTACLKWRLFPPDRYPATISASRHWRFLSPEPQGKLLLGRFSLRCCTSFELAWCMVPPPPPSPLPLLWILMTVCTLPPYPPPPPPLSFKTCCSESQPPRLEWTQKRPQWALGERGDFEHGCIKNSCLKYLPLALLGLMSSFSICRCCQRRRRLVYPVCYFRIDPRHQKDECWQTSSQSFF